MMEFIDKFNTAIHKPFFSKYSTLMGLWVLLGVIAWITKYFPGKYNNSSIFRQSFWHMLNELPLYAAYPEEYNGIFHYGPAFNLVVAPLAITPLQLGLLTWSVAQSLFLLWAVKMLPGIKREHIFIYWLYAHELLTSLFMSQFNISIAAIIVLAYVSVEKEKDVWAALVIMLGIFTKLYGITGLAFFFFSRHKMRFSLSCIGWVVIMVVAPMILFGPDYIMSQYTGWFEDLSGKNLENSFTLMQNISFLGMVRKISGSVSCSDIYLIIGGSILFGLPYLRINQHKYEAFRKTLLASVLMFVVLLSTGSEFNTYIIVLIGVATWYTAVPWKRSILDIVLMVFAFLLTSMSPSDLFPKYIRAHYVYPYVSKALPCILIRLKLTFEMCTRSYNPIKV